MNLFELEASRKKSILKFSISAIGFLISLAGIIYYFYKYIDKIDTWGMHWVYIIIGVIGVTYLGSACSGISKKYENLVKQNLMKNILDNIVQGDGEVNWEAHDIDDKRYSSDGPLYNEDEFKNIEEEDGEDLEKRINKIETMVDNRLKVCESLCRSTMVSNIFGAYLDQDDIFYGKYKGIEFSSVEAHDTASKNHAAVFNGTLLEIRLKKTYENEVLCLKKMFFVADSWYSSIKKGLKKLKIDLPVKKNFEIYTKTPDNISEILNPDFINFLNSVKNEYSYLILGNCLYVIMPHGNDKYKLGNLFKSIENETQNSKVVQDIRELLNIVERAGNLGL